MERKDLNDFLKVKGGLAPNGTSQLYKLVWSTTELELRHGTFREFHDDVFVREVTETRWTRKYSYIHDRWILERYIPPELVASAKELVLGNEGSYEPIYVFEDGDRQYLEPNIKVLEFILNMAERPHHITQTELMNQLKDREEKEVLAIMEAMDYRSDIGAALATGSGVAFGQKSKNVITEGLN